MDIKELHKPEILRDMKDLMISHLYLKFEFKDAIVELNRHGAISHTGIVGREVLEKMIKYHHIECGHPLKWFYIKDLRDEITRRRIPGLLVDKSSLVGIGPNRVPSPEVLQPREDRTPARRTRAS